MRATTSDGGAVLANTCVVDGRTACDGQGIARRITVMQLGMHRPSPRSWDIPTATRVSEASVAIGQLSSTIEPLLASADVGGGIGNPSWS